MGFIVTIWHEKKKKKMFCSSVDRAKWLCITDPSGRSISLDALSNSKKIHEHLPDTINGHFSSPNYNIFLCLRQS